jgi:sugar phosphate isomerase/epimerase
MKRREFLSVASLALAASALRPVVAAPARKPLGIEMFSIPKLAEKDLPGTLARLAGMGYTQVQFYGPFDFSPAATIASWKALEPRLGFSGSGFYGQSAKQVRAILNENHLSAPSLHTDLETLQEAMGPLADASHVLGAQYVILPAIPEDRRKTLDDYRRMADVFNSIGRTAQRHGVKFGYHNHGYGWHEMEGKIPERVLFEHTDPKLVYLEMDVFWTTAAGVDPVQLLEDYPTRYKQLHLKDMKERRQFKGDGGDPGQWMELFPLMTSAGDGVIDLKGIVAEGKKVGIEEYIVEQDIVADPLVALKRSADYVSGLL